MLWSSFPAPTLALPPPSLRVRRRKRKIASAIAVVIAARVTPAIAIPMDVVVVIIIIIVVIVRWWWLAGARYYLAVRAVTLRQTSPANFPYIQVLWTINHQLRKAGYEVVVSSSQTLGISKTNSWVLSFNKMLHYVSDSTSTPILIELHSFPKPQSRKYHRLTPDP